MHLILPKTLPNLEPYTHLPLFFLMGPILGAGDWHCRMTDLLIGHVGECVIVNPSRYGPDHRHYKYRLDGPNRFARQLAWERHFLRTAAYDWGRGCIVAWFACESREEPRMDGKPYAMSTRREVGEWYTRLQVRPDTRIVAGGEEAFPGLDEFDRCFTEAAGMDFTIHRRMEDVARHAAKYAKLPSRTDRVLS